MTDELSAPLGMEPRKPRSERSLAPKNWASRILAAGLGCGIAGIGSYILLTNDPLGGEPVVIVSLDKQIAPGTTMTASADAATGGSATAAPTDNASSAAKPEGQSVTVIDGLSGKRQQVTFGKGGEAAKVITIDPGTAPDAKAATGAPAKVQSGDGSTAGVTVRAASPAEIREATAAKGGSAGLPQVKTGNPALLEPTRFGMLPKIAANGTRSVEAYAGTPDAKAQDAGAPRIAIVLSRLGVSTNTTAEALAKLPASITLGFVPSAPDLDRLIARARGDGREVLLQVPMEPFDFPDNDPGPQALMVQLSPEQNVDRLQAFMGRTQGYVGIAPFMGQKFVSQEGAVSPVLREAAKRGLLFFDDATASRSVMPQAAAAQNVPFSRADVVLDEVPSKTEIDAQLRKLESIGRERGFAVGSANVSPAMIERLAAWAKGLSARGIALVPLTALVNKPKSS